MSSARLYDTIGAAYIVTRRVARRVVVFTHDASDPDRFWRRGRA